ncbi:MAG: hypothetical protein KF894_08875 [Labilithrix sp.]|nr:hypothetical protein [Labilithrix sp.]
MLHKLTPFLFVGLAPLVCCVQGPPGADGGGGSAEPPGAPPPAAPSTIADRIAAIKASADEAETPAGGADAGAAPPPAGAAPTLPEDPKAKAATDRAARIEALRAKSRQAQTKRQAHKASRAEQEELAQLRQLKADWEKKDSAFADVGELLAEAERRGHTGEKVLAYIRDQMTNPAAITDRRVAASKTEVQKQIDELKEELRQRDERDAQARAAAESEQKTLVAAKNFIALSQTKAEDAPLTAAMYAKHGAEVVIGFANQFIIPLMPEDFDIEEPAHLEVLHDHMEQFLSETQLTPAPAKTDTSSKANAGKKNGAKPVTTLSNRTVTEVGTVEQAVPLEKMTTEERYRFVKEKYERGDE